MGEVLKDLEYFESLEAAREALLDRYGLGHWQPQDFHYVNRPGSSDLCPAVSEDTEMQVFYTNPTEEGNTYPDAQIKLGFNEEEEAFTYVEPC